MDVDRHHHIHYNKHDFVMEGLLRYSQKKKKNTILIKRIGLSLLLDLTDHK